MARELSRSIFRGEIDNFDQLLEKEGLDINTVSEKEKWNFLHLALQSVVRTPIPAMIEHLIKRGVDVNAVDCYGNTPLHYAARAKNSESIELLLKAGAEIDPVNVEGITPLRQTLIGKPKNIKSIEALLSHGANVHQKPDGGCTVMEYAETISHGDDAEILKLFEKHIN